MRALKRGRVENLLPPMRPGDPSRNPEGRNQYSADRELRQEYRAIGRAIDEAPERVADAIYERFAAALEHRMADASHGHDRLLLAILDREWPAAQPGPIRAGVRERSAA